MSTTHRPKTDADDKPTVEELLARAESGRTRVSRILEHVRDDRTPDRVHHKDWFATLEHVKTETNVDLVLYSESTHEDAPDSAKILAVDDQYGRIIHCGWSEYSGEFQKPTYQNRDDVEEGFRFYQSGDETPEILRLEDAKDQLREFAAAHEGGDE